MAGTTGLEPAASAVTVQQPEVTSCNFTAPIATLGALRNPRELLLHPNCTQIARPVNASAFFGTNLEAYIVDGSVQNAINVTVLAAGFTNTAVLEKFGFDPKTMPMKPMSVEQCVSEGLSGLLKNRSRIVPGRLNRIMNALVPASLARKMEADMLGKGLASKSAVASARGEAASAIVPRNALVKSDVDDSSAKMYSEF
jgi:hypothetical protein